jgi:hypothetical protein
MFEPNIGPLNAPTDFCLLPGFMHMNSLLFSILANEYELSSKLPPPTPSRGPWIVIGSKYLVIRGGLTYLSGGAVPSKLGCAELPTAPSQSDFGVEFAGSVRGNSRVALV